MSKTIGKVTRRHLQAELDLIRSKYSRDVLASAWTVWAVLVFAVIMSWAWRPANRKRFEQDARIPLNDED